MSDAPFTNRVTLDLSAAEAALLARALRQVMSRCSASDRDGVTALRMKLANARDEARRPFAFQNPRTP